MIGLGFLLFSGLTLLLYLGWLGLVVKVFRSIGGHKFFVPIKVLGAVILALAPLHEALVYPLLRNECDQNGRGITYSRDVGQARSLVIEGQHHNLKSPDPVLRLFSAGSIDSVYFGRNTSYGENWRIVSAAQVHDGNGFDLSVADADNVACGPYYKYASQHQNLPLLEKSKCLAFSRNSHHENYILVSKTSEIERSWKTLFHNINWEVTKIDLVGPDERRSLHALREFTHKGLGFPLFLNLTSIGDFVCRADKRPDVILDELLPKQNPPDKDAILTKGLSIEKLEALTRKFWGFEVPERAYLFKVGVWDHNHLSSSKASLSVTLEVPIIETPVILELMNNSPVDWFIQADQRQAVFVEQFVPKPGDTVRGVQPNQVWKFDDSEKKKNLLLMFYYGRMLQTKHNAIQQHQSCEVTQVPKSITSTIQLDSCGKS